MDNEPYRLVGRQVANISSFDKVTGRAQYVADLKLPWMLEAKILRSPHPHARILHIDLERARRLPGVRAIITARDLPRVELGLQIKDQLPLALDVVRYIGDEVAAVAAEDKDIAEEAIGLISVEYEELEAVCDPRQAMAPGAPLIHPRAEGNVATKYHIERGDVEQGFRESDLVFEHVFRTPMVQPTYLEPLGCVCAYGPSGKLNVWTPTQSAFGLRLELAHALQIKPSGIRIMVTDIGGGFGGKVTLRPMYPIGAVLARLTGRPVRLVFSRLEEFLTTKPRVAADITLRTGVKKDGRLVAKKATIIGDNGAYSWDAPKSLLNMSMRSDCLYRYQHVETESLLVYTNKVPTGAFRGFGNPQMHLAVEVQLDLIAKELGLDPVDLRLKNAVRTGDHTVHGWKIRGCGLKECIEAVDNAIRLETDLESGAGPQAGGADGETAWGLACAVHVSGNRSKSGFDGSAATLQLDEDGTLKIFTGESDMGQGAHTVFTQIVAEVLHVPMAAITLSPVDTDVSPRCLGAYSSRVTTVGGMAVKLAAEQMKGLILAEAGGLWGVKAEDVRIKGGIVATNAGPGGSMTLGELAGRLALHEGKSLKASVVYDPPTEKLDEGFFGDYSSGYTFAAHGVKVKVDRDTGQVTVLKVVAAHDVGKAINLQGVQGQIHGGVAQGLGWALMERLVIVDGKILNANLHDYQIMTSLDIPKIFPVLVETNNPQSPFGAKGIGEPALIPTAPALVNAVNQAMDLQLNQIPLDLSAVVSHDRKP